MKQHIIRNSLHFQKRLVYTGGRAACLPHSLPACLCWKILAAAPADPATAAESGGDGCVQHRTNGACTTTPRHGVPSVAQPPNRILKYDMRPFLQPESKPKRGWGDSAAKRSGLKAMFWWSEGFYDNESRTLVLVTKLHLYFDAHGLQHMLDEMRCNASLLFASNAATMPTGLKETSYPSQLVRQKLTRHQRTIRRQRTW